MYTTRWKNYLTNEQKKQIESIELTSNQWSGYKNVEFNITIWEDIFNSLNKYIPSNNEKNINILDYGFGPGWSKVVGDKITSHNIVGLDIDLPKPNLEFKKFHDITNKSVKKWDGKKMPFENNTFEIITAKASLHKMVNTEELVMFDELFRVSAQNSLWLIGPKYQFDKFCDMISQKKYQERYQSLIVEKNIKFGYFEWDINNHQNNIFQPIYAKE